MISDLNILKNINLNKHGKYIIKLHYKWEAQRSFNPFKLTRNFPYTKLNVEKDN